MKLKTALILFLVWIGLLGTVGLTTRKVNAAPPAQIEEVAHTNTMALYRVQDGGCVIYLAQGVQGIAPNGVVTIALTPRCQ